MFLFPQRYVYAAAGFCLVVACVFATLSWFVGIKKDVVLHTIGERISTVHEKLINSVDLTGKNQVDTDTDHILRDCDQRQEYEHTLSQLNTGLSTAEMHQALGLYEACGDFFALRKRIMLMKMHMFFDELVVSLNMYKEYSDSTLYEKLIPSWEAILAAETDRTALLSEQAQLQGDIIKTLSKNPQADLREKLARAEDIGQQLDVQYAQTEALKKDESEVWSRIITPR